MIDKLISLNKRYYHWAYWKLQNEFKPVRKSMFNPSFANNGMGWPMGVMDRRNWKWAWEHDYAVAYPWVKEQERLTRRYVWIDRKLRAFK